MNVIEEAKEVSQYRFVGGLDLEQFRPSPHHLVVQWIHKEETKAGILYPQDRQRLGLMKGRVLRVSDKMDEPKVRPGEFIVFDGLCEKEFLTPQSRGSLDPVFIMTEANVFGVHAGPGKLEMINDFVMVRADEEKAERSGLVVVDREQRHHSIWGTVVGAGKDFKPGDRILYQKATKTDVRLGDFEGELCHVIPGNAVEAIEEAQ